MADKTPVNPAAAAAEELYKTVMSQSQDEKGGFTVVFTQQELFEIAPESVTDKKDMLPLIKYLTGQHLFRTLKTADRGLGWSVRPREAAKAIKALDKDERMVYEVIEASHTTGIWLKSIKNKLNGIAQPVVAKITKTLESQRLIKPVKSIKAPAQRVFMLFHLVPSEDVTGNSFFDAGDLDESFRDELLNLIVFWVRSQSWAEGERKRHRRKSSNKKEIMPREDAIVIEEPANEIAVTGQKRKRPATDIEELSVKPRYQRSHKFDPETDFAQLTYRAGTESYPTAEKIHIFLTSSDAIKATKSASLTVQEVQGCLDVLVWDDKLEKVWNVEDGNWGYRTRRGVTFRQPGQTFDIEEDAVGTGLTQAPCGRCPVFDVCRDGGPVNPQTCVYFDAWLQD
ncbi:DNA-directed RNA polymerase III subunit RPC6 [Sphaerulina musiva]